MLSSFPRPASFAIQAGAELVAGLPGASGADSTSSEKVGALDMTDHILTTAELRGGSPDMEARAACRTRQMALIESILQDYGPVFRELARR